MNIIPLEQQIAMGKAYLNKRCLQVGHLLPLNERLFNEYFPPGISFLIFRGKEPEALFSYRPGAQAERPSAWFRAVADGKRGWKDALKKVEETAIAQERIIVGTTVFGYDRKKLQALTAPGYVIGARLPESVSLRGKRYDLCILYKDLTDRYDFSVKRSYAKPGLYPSVDVQKAKSPKLKVRGYRPEDQLKLEKFAIHPNVIRRVGLLFAGLSPWPAGSGPPYQEMVNSGRSYPLVCEDETTGEPIGVLWLFASSQDVMQHVMELGMGVKPEYQGIGVGTMLMENMKTLAKRLHLTRVNLTVFEDNVPAQHLYRKTGFVECGKIPGWLQERYVSETYMTLKLK